MNYEFQIGYDYVAYLTGYKQPLYIPLGHTCIVGSSGTGKSTALLYFLYKMRKAGIPVELYIMDFKASHEFMGITENFGEFEACYEKIVLFYKMFTSLPEGGDGKIKILLIDEIAGMLSHMSMTKEGKNKADEVRMIMSSILMLGRSRRCFLWLAMQRYTATIFPASSGGGDNFHTCCGLGRLTVDGRRALFAGEHLANEEDLLFKQGTGIVLSDGQPLKALIIPKVSKARLLELLTKR